MNANLRKIERALALVNPVAIRLRGRRQPGWSAALSDTAMLQANAAVTALIALRVTFERAGDHRALGSLLRGGQ
jgi:hypothetical protein